MKLSRHLSLLAVLLSLVICSGCKSDETISETGNHETVELIDTDTVESVNTNLAIDEEVNKNTSIPQVINTDNWQVYTDAVNDYSVRYPSDWVYFNEVRNDGLAYNPQADSSSMRFTKQDNLRAINSFVDITINVQDDKPEEGVQYIERDDHYYVFDGGTWATTESLSILEAMIDSIKFDANIILNDGIYSLDDRYFWIANGTKEEVENDNPLSIFQNALATDDGRIVQLTAEDIQALGCLDFGESGACGDLLNSNWQYYVELQQEVIGKIVISEDDIEQQLYYIPATDEIEGLSRRPMEQILDYLDGIAKEIDEEVLKNIPDANSLPSISTDAADWFIYVNNEYGFSFKYPKEWKISQDIFDAYKASYDNRRYQVTEKDVVFLTSLTDDEIDVELDSYHNNEGVSRGIIESIAQGQLISVAASEKSVSDLTSEAGFTFTIGEDMALDTDLKATNVYLDKTWEGESKYHYVYIPFQADQTTNLGDEVKSVVFTIETNDEDYEEATLLQIAKSFTSL